MLWDAEDYIQKHRFTTNYGGSLLKDVPECDAILDVGCGTGALTKLLSRKATFVRGIDHSKEAIQEAKRQFPNLDVSLADILDYEDAHRYDLVFSNAVFHLIPEQKQSQLLIKIRKLLSLQGLLITEFSGAYNYAKIRKAFDVSLKRYHKKSTLRFYLPGPMTYQHLLQQEGFIAQTLCHVYQPTTLPDGYHGLPTWLTQFFKSDLARFSSEEQKDIIQQTCDQLMPELWDGTSWYLDCWQLQVIAQKGQSPRCGD